MKTLNTKTLSLSLAAIMCAGMVGCSSSGGVNPPATKPVVPTKPTTPTQPTKPTTPTKPTEPEKPKPLADLNEADPKAGEFIKNADKAATLKVNLDDTSTVTLAVKDNVVTEKATAKIDKRKREMVTGIHSIHYDDKGNLHGFTALNKGAIVKSDTRTQASANKFNKIFSENLSKKTVKHYTDHETAVSGATYDAGLQVGGKFSGVYARDDQARSGYVFRDPAVAGWNYQTFGNFKEDENFNIQVGYQSLGKNTTKAQLPTKGTASYTGISSGHIFYPNPAFEGHGDQTTANVKIDANFTDRSLSFETEDTKRHTLQVVDGKVSFKTKAANEFNLKGTAKWSADSAKFVGTDLKAGQAAKLETGKLQGSFYGNKAAEAGGVFNLQSADKKTTYIGGFGAKRK